MPRHAAKAFQVQDVFDRNALPLDYGLPGSTQRSGYLGKPAG
jgi:hypothetical protein